MKARFLLQGMMAVLAVSLAAPAQEKPRPGIPAARTSAPPAAPAPKVPAAISSDKATTPQNDAAIPPALPNGTAVRMNLESAISTSFTQEGSSFVGRVTEDVVLEGKTVIPVGASIQGRVARLSQPRRIRGAPSIDLRPEQVVMPNGDKFSISAAVVDTDRASDTGVTDEGRITGHTRHQRDLVLLGAGAGIGAGVGAVLAGPHGALVGSAIGGAAAAVHWLTRRNSATLPAGTEIILELSRPMVLTTTVANGG